MKTVKVKCARCGKEWEVDRKSAKKQLECPHCHRIQCLSPKSQGKIKVVRYLVMLVIALVFVLAMLDFNKTNNLPFIIIVLLFAFVLSQFIDEWCRIIAFTLFGFEYLDVDEYAKVRKPVMGEKKEKKK